MRVLVTGAAGYIGSHALLELARAGHTAIALDDLRLGHRDAVTALLAREPVDAILHFAAYCYVGESVRDPAKYYANNVLGTLRLAEAALAAKVPVFVLSSTCATYGEPERMPIDEGTPQRPVNPYGRSKLMAEQVLLDLAAAATERGEALRPVFLRYFNAAGCDPQGRLGEDHAPETHLIPNALAAALRRRPSLEVFGTDYPTPDGTCVRDYVHVTDLAAAHVQALERAAAARLRHAAFNLGTGRGSSVREVIAAVERVTGAAVPVEFRPRRAGDPPVLVAAAQRARDELGFEPRHSDLDTIVATAFRWLEANPAGYGDRR
jgi:UDP-glucose-4-epimerase GalE